MDADIESALLSDLDRELQRPRFSLVGKRISRQKKNVPRLHPAKDFLNASAMISQRKLAIS